MILEIRISDPDFQHPVKSGIQKNNEPRTYVISTFNAELKNISDWNIINKLLISY